MDNTVGDTPKEPAQKSFDELLTDGFGAENKEALDRLLAHARTMMKSGSDYVEKNPREAMAIALGVGIAAYITLATKPGRRVAEVAVVVFLPKIKDWFIQFFNRSKDSQIKIETDADSVHH